MIKDNLDKWDVENQDYVGTAHKYNYADFTAYETTFDREEKFSLINEALKKDRKDYLTTELDVDTTQLEYNKFNDFYKGLEQFREPQVIEPEKYEQGKQAYQEIKNEYKDIGHESF